MFNRMHRSWGRLAIAARLLVLLGLLVACAPAGDAGVPTEPPAGEESEGSTEGEEVEVVMRSTAFQPEEIVVSPGTTVTWRNEDSLPHTVTSGARGDPTDLFDETVPGGGTFSFTFDDPGTYEYFCSLHPGMSGVVTVEE